MSDRNLPQITTGRQLNTRSVARPSLLTAAGRRERATGIELDRIASEAFLARVATQARIDEEVMAGARKVEGTIAIEEVGALGMASFGDRVSAQLSGSSLLAQQLASEVLNGSAARVQGVMNSAVRRIDNA